MEEVGMGMVSFIRVAWILATFPVAVACFPLPGLGWFRTALLGIAKRGKILQSKSNLTVPQRFFFHFYVVGVLWTTILLVSVWSYAMREHVYNVWLSVFLLVLMEIQVLRRFYESIYVFNYSPSARMHIFGYLVGIFFYALAPLSLCCNFATQVFDFVSGRAHMSRPGFDNIWMFVTPFLMLPWYAWIGGAIFLWGWVHQLRCHQILGSLRDKSEKLEEYVIPYGDWFEYVSSPHYTAEIVIYGGLVVASGGADLSLWLLLAFVVANLVFAAIETQIWYRHKFDNYPRNRCIIFPFVY
ncbi:polyprenol reductase 2 [Lactuca sativa]|uniref:3-oxo-5-alpha-steroid 4-dehydrogenase C-terminal domain-containing protein n=1 Tax=Lactuca sativa TaxID=4236 RepID=A0A9R1W259_LACSA|nr:polyprenol reductase 2 [Lactuca sativa]KAJ0215688.1 hypothetical protein LSAT_V11C300119350 [Lactuca sativa]